MTPGYIFISSNHDVYVSMPYIAIDFSSGTYLQYWASNGCNLEVGTMTDPYDHSTFHLLEVCPIVKGMLGNSIPLTFQEHLSVTIILLFIKLMWAIMRSWTIYE